MQERALIGAFIVALAIITWQEISNGVDDFDGRGLPIPAPARYVDAGIVFGLLGLLALAAPGVAAVLGWGTLLALLIANGQPLTAVATKTRKKNS